jgi:hypothetical protein
VANCALLMGDGRLAFGARGNLYRRRLADRQKPTQASFAEPMFSLANQSNAAIAFDDTRPT